MGVLDIIDTNRVELSKEVRYHPLFSSFHQSLSCPQAAVSSVSIRREAQQIKREFLKV